MLEKVTEGQLLSSVELGVFDDIQALLLWAVRLNSLLVNY